MKNKVAIIGKTNTGKSTLFNRLLGFRKAIVLSEAGITRDRNYADLNWQGREFTLIDTGGIDYTNKQDLVQKSVFEQVKKAIMEADLIIHLVDVMTGIQQEDTDLAKFIRKNKKKSILVINKNDIKDKHYFLGDFYHLGLGEPCLISAEHGININGLLDRIIELIPYNNKEKFASENDLNYLIRVAIIGKPNVGKSSILNALLNEERAIVDKQPGTTRDAIDASINFEKYKLEFVDTAGLRRRKSVKNKIEYFGNLRTIASIKKADVVLLVLDASSAISMQDKRLAKKIREEKKAVIVLLNKYDLVAKNKDIDKASLLQISKYNLKFLKGAPLLTTIAVGPKKNSSHIIKTIIEVFNRFNKKITTSELNNLLQIIVNNKPPNIIKGRRLRFYYITQTGTKPPSFKIFVNEPDLLYNSYQRYLENEFIRNFELEGIPIVFHYEKS